MNRETIDRIIDKLDLEQRIPKIEPQKLFEENKISAESLEILKKNFPAEHRDQLRFYVEIVLGHLENERQRLKKDGWKGKKEFAMIMGSWRAGKDSLLEKQKDLLGIGHAIKNSSDGYKEIIGQKLGVEKLPDDLFSGIFQHPTGEMGLMGIYLGLKAGLPVHHVFAGMYMPPIPEYVQWAKEADVVPQMFFITAPRETIQQRAKDFPLPSGHCINPYILDCSIQLTTEGAEHYAPMTDRFTVIENDGKLGESRIVAEKHRGKLRWYDQRAREHFERNKKGAFINENQPPQNPALQGLLNGVENERNWREKNLIDFEPIQHETKSINRFSNKILQKIENVVTRIYSS